MAVDPEFLKILEEEEEKAKKGVVLPSNLAKPTTLEEAVANQLFIQAPKKIDEKIPEWTGKGEIVWPSGKEHRGLTVQEEKALLDLDEVKWRREHADLGDRMEAGVQGFFPVGDKEELEQAFPLSRLGGKLTRYAAEFAMAASGLESIGVGIQGFFTQPGRPMAELLKLGIPSFTGGVASKILFSESFPAMASHAVKRSIMLSADRFAENFVRGVTGEGLTTKKMLAEPVGEALFGAALGAAGGAYTIPVAGAIGATAGVARETVQQLVKDGKIDKEDLTDIGISAALYGMIESIAHIDFGATLTPHKEITGPATGAVKRQLTGVAKKLRLKDIQQFEFDRAYAKALMRGQDSAAAKTTATLATQHLGPFGHSMRRAAYEQIVKNNLPKQITEAQGDAADKIVSNLIKYARQPGTKAIEPIANLVSKTFKELANTDFINTSISKIAENEQVMDMLKVSMSTAKGKVAESIKGNIDALVQTNKELKENIELAKQAPEVKELPVYEKYLELPAPKSREGLSTYGQMRYGKALEQTLLDHELLDQEKIYNIKKGKSFSYIKEKAMTDREAAEVIHIYEDMINTASQFEGPQFKKTIKEMEKLRQKYLKAHEKGVFADVVRSAMPEELQSMVGKEWTLLDYIRPSWRTFRKNPVLWRHGYIPASMQYGLREKFQNVAIQEARAKAKEFKLTKLDRMQVTAYRNYLYLKKKGEEVTPVTLDARQMRWNDWLTKQFSGLHSFFEVERQIDFDKYIPWRWDLDKADQGYLNEIFPDRMPANITAFFEKRRTSKKFDKEKFREDSLELYEDYIRVGAKKKYMLPAIKQAKKYVTQNPTIPPGMKKHFQDWMVWMMGYPSLADNSFAALFENQGLSYDHAHMVARFFMDLVYMGGIGFRPMSAVRNAFQDLNTICELGYVHTLAGYRDFMMNGGIKHAKEMGVITDYAPELYSEYGEYTDMMKLRDASLVLFRAMDMKNRAIAYYAAEHKFNSNFKKYGVSDTFFQKSGINFTDKPIRTTIKDLAKQGKIGEARHEFAKEIVGKTQYLYNKEDSPLINKSIAGKMLFQFKSWPENYGELLADWGRNSNYQAMLRAAITYTMLAVIAKNLGSKFLMKTIPLFSLPFDKWQVEKNGIPAALGPWIDLATLFGATLMTGLETQDINKTSQTFERGLKRFGKDILLYIPGGLAMKDFFKIKGIIPKFSFAPQQQQMQQPKKKPGELVFKKLGEGGQLKFKKF